MTSARHFSDNPPAKADLWWVTETSCCPAKLCSFLLSLSVRGNSPLDFISVAEEPAAPDESPPSGGCLRSSNSRSRTKRRGFPGKPPHRTHGNSAPFACKHTNPTPCASAGEHELLEGLRSTARGNGKRGIKASRATLLNYHSEN